MSNRINVTFDKETYQDLNHLAGCKEVSLSEIVRECVSNYLEDLEDKYLSNLADKRITEDQNRKYLSSEEFWSRVIQD